MCIRDSYYTAESLVAYYEALEQAEFVLKKSEEEKWDSTKQSMLDETAAVSYTHLTK